MTAAQRQLIIRTVRGTSLACIVAGLLVGIWRGRAVQPWSPAEELRYLEAQDPSDEFYAPHLPELAQLRALRDAGRLSTRRPIDSIAMWHFTMGLVPFLLVAGVLWWIARFIQAGDPAG